MSASDIYKVITIYKDWGKEDKAKYYESVLRKNF